MIKLADKFSCTGCGACASSCAANAIRMERDAEGFLQPVINTDKCKECGLCQKKCPELHPLMRTDYSRQEVYAVISKNDRNVSSSGGAFSVFARWILKQGGVVVGATMDINLYVHHIIIDSIEQLKLLRGSKYVQSDLKNTYKDVKKILLGGRKVLFTGTGCQVAGLYAFLGGKRYDGLLFTLDLVCHGAPSQGVFDSYLSKLQKKLALTDKNIEGFQFRKLDSWDYRPTIKFSELKWRLLSLSENAYMEAFFKGITFRESCFNCQYCNTQRIGTFTIADFWGIGRHGAKFLKNVSSGVSLVIDNLGVLNEIKAELDKYAYIEKRTMSEAIAEQSNLKYPMERLKERDSAIKSMMDESVSLEDFSKQYGFPYKPSFKWWVGTQIKNLIYALNLYNVYKTIIYKMGK